MTVCVAALGQLPEGRFVIGLSDRMLSSSDQEIQFEPDQPKIFPVSNSIALMWAGDASVQAEILQDLRTAVVARIVKHPKAWWGVREVAQLYSDFYHAASVRRAESILLKPLGLDLSSFIAQQQHLDPAVASRLSKELQYFSLPETQAIVAGIDETGAHIYAIEGGKCVCQDTPGFAAVGIGQRHALSQLMFGGHSPSRTFPETASLIYAAKKRSEVAAGIGKETDMFTVGPRIGTYWSDYQDLLLELESGYLRMLRRQSKAERDRVSRLEKYFASQREAAAARQTGNVDPAG